MNRKPVYMIGLIMMLISTAGCQTVSTGDYCTTYQPVYTNDFERDVMRDNTVKTINKNNAVWACQCNKEREFCE